MLLLLLLVLLTCRALSNKVLSPSADVPGPSLSSHLLLDDGLLDEAPEDGWRQNGTEELNDCGPCELDLCPETRACRAGLVPDACSCCQECGNLEGQACDLGDRSRFYGLCGTGLRCEEAPGGEGEGEEEQVCVCEEQEIVCGSDGTTYMNMCQFREAAFSKLDLHTRGRGPCRTAPVIKVPPQSQVNGPGSSLVFLCEVFAFPMALVEWRKEGREDVLPGDDPHISIQLSIEDVEDVWIFDLMIVGFLLIGVGGYLAFCKTGMTGAIGGRPASMDGTVRVDTSQTGTLLEVNRKLDNVLAALPVLACKIDNISERVTGRCGDV